MADDEKEFDKVYDDTGREDLVENDEISPEEEGFMAGYEEQKERKPKEYEGDKAYNKAFDSRDTKKTRKKR